MAYLDQFLDQAREAFARNRRLDPGVIARMDQTQARNNAVDRKVADILGVEPQALRSGLHIQALMMAIGAAAQRIKPRPCPHFDFGTPPYEQDIRINLSFAQANCAACEDRLIAEHLAQHGLDVVNGPGFDHCDLCDKPTEFFREVNTQWGVAHVSMNVCDECFDWMQPDYVQRFPAA
jgi:hypothetical protein